jgi:hypothetical protein
MPVKSNKVSLCSTEDKFEEAIQRIKNVNKMERKKIAMVGVGLIGGSLRFSCTKRNYHPGLLV